MTQRYERTLCLGSKANRNIAQTARHLLSIVAAQPDVSLDRVLLMLRRPAPERRPRAAHDGRREAGMR